MKNTPRKTIKKEVEQENVEVQAARGRLKGLLNNIIMEPEGAAAGADTPPKSKSNRGRPKRIRDRDVGAPGGKPYIIKLFDRMVNVSEFDDSTPLYPITRAWFYDRKNEQLAPQKPTDADLQPTYYKGRESLVRALTSGRIDRVAALPPPNEDEDVQRIPFCEPPSMDNGLNAFTADYDWDNSVVTTEELTSSYLDRWRKVREAWNLQSRHYSQRYEGSRRVLEAIAKK